MGIAQRTGIAVAAVTATGVALAGAFAGGVAWAGRDAEPRVEAVGDSPRLAPVTGALRPASDCDDLLSHYVEDNLERVGPYGWLGGGPVIWDGETFFDSGTDSAERSSPAASPALQGATSSGTGTNVQEVGVDEPDLAKTDGSILVRIDDHELTTYDVSGSGPVRLGSVDLPRDLTDPELLLVGDRVVVLGMEYDPVDPTLTTTHQLGVDISDPVDPVVSDRRTYDARLVSARQHGDVVRLVLGTGLPDLDFVAPGRFRDDDDATRRNQDILRDSVIEDWVPGVTTDDGTNPIADCEDVNLPADAPANGGVYVVGLDAASPDDTAVTGLATDTDLAYESADRLYLATGGAAAFGFGLCCERSQLPTIPEDLGRTDVHAFELDGAATTYVASGTVDGTIADRWAMDEYDGVLRVAVGPSTATGNFNSILTLEEDGDDLVEIGHVHKLGIDEQIQSMRWYDGLAVMVTFRQVDPLYAIDLTDARHPRTLGHLKIPGFSSYLHPLGTRRLLGMGQGADGSAQAAVFDLKDLTSPVRQAMVRYPQGTIAAAGVDPRQFTWLPERRVALTVITSGFEGQTGYVSVLTLADGVLSNRMVEVDYGYHVADIRLLPLASGRVALVTSDGVSFLRL